MIYFIQDTERLCIKIGHAEADVDARRRTLQTGNPSPLIVLWHMDGGEDAETALHRQFAADRVAGEWFRPSAALLMFLLTEAQMAARHTAMQDMEAQYASVPATVCSGGTGGASGGVPLCAAEKVEV